MRNTIILFFALFAFCDGFAQSGWIVQKSNTTDNLRAISTYDGVNAVAVGVNGRVLTTGNTGVPWVLQQNPTNQNLNGVTSISARILCAVGPKDSIYRSTDRGSTWKGVRSKVRGECYLIASVYELSAIDYDSVKNTCVAVGDGQEVIFSEDSGMNWEERPSLSVSGDVTSLKGVSASEGMVIAVGEREQSSGYSRILTSMNEGDTWVQRTANLPGVDKFGQSFYGCDTKAWIIVGAHGAIYHSTNFGTSWDSIPSFVTSNLNSVNFADEINGFICGDSGVILMTRDGGYNWVRQISPTKQNLRSVSMGNPFHGFMCGDSGTILYTQDGGFSGVQPANGSISFYIRNYPNPLSSQTKIRIYIPESGHMNIRIYNALGVDIATIADADYGAGSHIFEWNATDIPNGVYMCRMESGGKSIISQVIVTR